MTTPPEPPESVDPDATIPGAAARPASSVDSTARMPVVGDAGPGSPLPPDDGDGDGDGGGGGKWWWIAAAIIVVIAIIILIVLLAGSSSDDNSSTTTSRSTSTSTTTTTVARTTTTERTTTTAAPAAPTITSFTGPDTVRCSSATTVRLSWSTDNATKTTMTIDGAAQPGTFGATGTQDFPFPCDASPHAYLLTAFAADGRTVTQNKAIAQAP